MKSLFAFTLLTMSLSSFASYDPFHMTCLVNPKETDSANLRSISFSVDPDFADNQYVAIKGRDKKETGTFEDTFVYSYNELEQDAKSAVDQIAKRFKINVSQIFTITEFVMNSQGFFAYKISSEQGEIGKGLLVMGTVVHCK